ncbi:acyl-CoA dehydrogenase family protein [Streptomyces bohaiensis]|uniref:Acyl-CoA dehydrogenase/oxidase C-terminal domain-containing protein n=1 Tax=Streptomyces bohaiensis TaxID=1431344 RepID=A0ABX1C4D2_9ACTN|nr:acyl-CoA dehydrogenase family protein [Streptomyces bohaiensis]NJQ13718.1 hypothetical protein [Streptomyces bohaiensis]
MHLHPDPLLTELRTALRAGLSGIGAGTALHGPPVTDGGPGPTRQLLDALGADAFERPVADGGLGLGVTAGVAVSEELGLAAQGNAYRARAWAVELGSSPDAVPADPGAVPGAVPGGGRVEAVAVPGGWELTGTVTVDTVDAPAFLVAAQTGRGPVVLEVERTAPGLGTDDRCLPPVVRLDRSFVAAGAVVAEPGGTAEGALARARLRQAGYLLGIAAGAHRVAVAYTGHRAQFGSRLRDLPPVAFPLARALVRLRATRAAVYRGAWLVDTGAEHEGGTAPAAALATAAETAREVVRVGMQSCGVRAMTAELALQRYHRLAAVEAHRYGDPAALWRLVGAERLREAREARRRSGTGASPA